MEPFPKRQRLYAPMERSFPQSFQDEPAYCDELGDDLLEDEEEYHEEEEEPEAGYDPEEELQRKRAELDHKLKSTFESIFEKYERDFDGVGDEIDLETGEIVVNNGHIVQMLNEQDAGDTSRPRQALTEFTQEADELPSSSFDDTEIPDDEDDEEYEGEIMGDNNVVKDDMVEDDMIQCGFAKANRFPQDSPELGILNAPIAPERVRRQRPIPRPAPMLRPVQTKLLPSRADILAQFGPQLGPQIVEYVSRQHVVEAHHVESRRAPELPKRTAASRNIEPAWRAPTLLSDSQRRVESSWRVPELPSAAPVIRPVRNPTVILPEEERTLSSGASASIWAPVRPRGPRRLDGADNSALFRGESRAPNHVPESMWDPLGYGPVQKLGQDAHSSSLKRNAFTAEEDNMLSNWVSKLRRDGHVLSRGRWRGFEAEHPRHSATTWQRYYDRKFTYLSTNEVEGSDLSNSEVSVENSGYHPPPAVKAVEPQSKHEEETRERPARIRKPAQTDPRILSWNQAVNSIKSVDPVLHAGIMEDARRAGDEPQYSSFRRQEHQVLEDSEMDTPNQSQDNSPPPEIRPSYGDLPIRSSLAVERTPEQEDFLIPGAPCPHADCKHLPTILYKLQRRENEQLSEMCLHLFRLHHTTPFPCAEIGCSKKGEDGYFMQLDLVKHVKLTHKRISAMQRLRGRVDSALLDQQVATARPTMTSDPMQRSTSQNRDSDIMSPQKGHTRNLSSSQTPGFVTPRGMAGVAFTPMTSVSSLKANHSAAKVTAVRDISKSQHRTISDSLGGSSQLESSQPRVDAELAGHSAGSSEQRPRTPSSREPPRTFTGLQIPLTPQTCTGDSMGMPAAFSPTNPSNEFQEEISEQRPTVQASIESRPQVLIPSITTLTVQQSSSEAGSPSVPEPSTSTALPKQTHTVRKITRNIVDPTYEFSDEDLEVQPTVVPAQELSTPRQAPKQCAKVLLGPVSVSRRPTASILGPKAFVEPSVCSRLGALKAVAKPVASPHDNRPQVAKTVTKSVAGPSGSRPKSATKPAATPAAKKHRRDNSEDIDELSLGIDEFILLSSRQRHPLPVPQIGIKHEELVDSPAVLSVPATRKRKLDAVRDHGFDELSGPAHASRNNTSQPTIKTETDGPSLHLSRPAVPRRKGRPPKSKEAAESSSSQVRSSRAPEIVHVPSTPLLDLTPVRNARVNAERMKTIFDSEAEDKEDEPESPSHRPKNRPRGLSARPVDFGNKTPVTKSRWNRDSMKAEQVSVLVRTPGGTLRRCGVDGFECKRDFCFRCSAGLDQVA